MSELDPKRLEQMIENAVHHEQEREAVRAPAKWRDIFRIPAISTALVTACAVLLLVLSTPAPQSGGLSVDEHGQEIYELMMSDMFDVML
jgi:hypothetical protein